MAGDSYLDPSDDGAVSRHTIIIPLAGLHAAAWITAVFSILLTIGRLLIRWRKLRRLGLDDLLNAAAAALVIPFIVSCILSLDIEYNGQLYYLGVVEASPTRGDLEYALKLEITQLMLFWLIIYLVKASFLSLYWNLFSVSTRFRVLWWVTVVFTALSFGVTIMSSFWHCGSPSRIVDLDACMVTESKVAITLLSLWCALNVLGDLLLMIIPLVMVTSHLLGLELAQKLGLILVFSLVMFDMAFDIVRTVYSLSTSLSDQTNLNAIWTFIEPTIAVAVCALPHYRGLLSRKRRRSSTTDPYSSFRRVSGLQNSTIPTEMDIASIYSFPSKGPARNDA